MAESIRSCGGILHAIVVRPAGDKYEIVKGEVRWLAALHLKLDIVPIKVVEFDDLSHHARAAVDLIASAARAEFLPEELVYSLESLYKAFGINASEKVADSLPDLRAAVDDAPELKARVNTLLAACGIQQQFD